jgi:hypothetical protein
MINKRHPTGALNQPGMAGRKKEFVPLTSLRRHDPDQVIGVEAFSLLSADPIDSPSKEELSITTAINRCQTNTTIFSNSR